MELGDEWILRIRLLSRHWVFLVLFCVTLRGEYKNYNYGKEVGICKGPT